MTDKQATVDKIHDDVKGHDADESFTQRQIRTTAEVAANNAYDAVKEAERAFQDAVILSPIDGIVTQAIQIPGQTVGSSDIIARIVDTSAIYFDTDADEADISKISMGLPAEVILDSYPDKVFKGTVDQILPQVKTTSQGATVVTIRIKLDQTDIFFVDGLTGQASIITEETKNVLTIPQEALREDSTVIVSSDQGLRPQKVAPGIRSDTDVEIKEGLKEGEKVLLNPPAPGSNFTNGRGGNPLGGIFRFLGGGRGR